MSYDEKSKETPAHFVSLYALSLDHMDDIILSRDRMLILSPLHFNTEIARSQYTLDFLYLIILYSAYFFVFVCFYYLYF